MEINSLHKFTCINHVTCLSIATRITLENNDWFITGNKGRKKGGVGAGYQKVRKSNMMATMYEVTQNKVHPHPLYKSFIHNIKEISVFTVEKSKSNQELYFLLYGHAIPV